MIKDTKSKKADYPFSPEVTGTKSESRFKKYVLRTENKISNIKLFKEDFLIHFDENNDRIFFSNTVLLYNRI